MKKTSQALLTVVYLAIGCSLTFAQVADPHTCYLNAPKGEASVEYLPQPSIVRCLATLNKLDADAALKRAVLITSPDAVTWLQTQGYKEQITAAETTVLSQIAETVTQTTQNGSTALSSAGTSLVTKSASSILGIAEESGAVSSTTSGSSTTLTANIQQLANFLHLSPKPCYIIAADCTVGTLLTRGASIAASFSPTTQSNGLSALENSALSGATGVQTPAFNNLTFQENLHGRRKNFTKPKFQAAIDKIDGVLKTDVATKFATLANDITVNNPAYDKALASCVADLEKEATIPNQAESLAKIKSAEENCAKEILASVEDVAALQSAIKAYVTADNAYATARDAALAAAFYPNTYSVEYDLTNNAAQPLTSTFKVIYGYTRQNASSDKSSQLQLTFNGSATIYNSLQGSSESRLRSAQAATQLDWKPNSTQKLQAELSAGYYFQYMVANGITNLPSTALAPGTSIALPSGASVLLNTTGPIQIGQGKLTLSIKNTNFKIPIAITGASRTDLIKANRVIGNFGISYDFSSLFSK